MHYNVTLTVKLHMRIEAFFVAEALELAIDHCCEGTSEHIELLGIDIIDEEVALPEEE